jgi:hypothetical protein
MAKFREGNLDLKDNQKVRMGDNQDAELYWDGSNAIIATAGSFGVSGGLLNIGTLDTTPGVVNLYPSVSGTKYGPSIYLYNSQGYDATYDYWRVTTYQGELILGPDTDVNMILIDENFSLTAGDLVVSAGNLDVTVGNITVGGTVDGVDVANHIHDGDTLQLDGINSDGGTFLFTTTGDVIYNQAISGTIYYGDGSNLTGMLFTEDASDNIYGGTGAGESLQAAGTDNFLAGVNAGSDITTHDKNVVIGTEALQYLLGTSNIALGYQALKGGGPGATGNTNIGIGELAGTALSGTSGGNILMGYSAGKSLTTGWANTLIGYTCGDEFTTSEYNVGIGYGCMSTVGNGAASYNIALGYYAARTVAGNNNVAIGHYAGDLVGTGVSNVLIGVNAGRNMANQSGNVFVGGQAGQDCTTSGNVFLGYNAGMNETTNNQRLYIANSNTNSPLIYGEFDTGLVKIHGDFTTAGDSIIIGNQLITGNLTVSGTFPSFLTEDASNNIYGGTGSVASMIAGAVDNFVVGVNAGAGFTNNDYNVAIGSEAMQYLVGTYNTAIGYQAAKGGPGGSGHSNVAIGHLAGTAISGSQGYNVIVGPWAGSAVTAGGYNTFLGGYAGYKITTGTYNVAVGMNALYSAASSSASNNIGIGYYTGGATLAGNDNIMIGVNAGYQMGTGAANVLIGTNAAYAAISKAGNTMIGSGVGKNCTTSGNVFLGYQAGFNETTNDQTLYIANSNTATPLIYGRFDTAIVQINGALQMAGNITPTVSGIYDLGTAALPFADIYSTGGSIYINKIKTIYAIGNDIVISGTHYGDGSGLTGVTAGASNPTNVGTDDDTPGVVNIYGGGNTEAGGSLRIYHPADQDDNVDYWMLNSEAGRDDLVIGPNDGQEVITLYGTGSGHKCNKLVFNEDGQDVDIIFESVGVNAISINGANGQVTFGAEIYGNGSNLTGVGIFTENSDYTIYGGTDAGSSLTSGTNNFLAGYKAGEAITDEDDNIAIGQYSGQGDAITGYDWTVSVPSGTISKYFGDATIGARFTKVLRITNDDVAARTVYFNQATGASCGWAYDATKQATEIAQGGYLDLEIYFTPTGTAMCSASLDIQWIDGVLKSITPTYSGTGVYGNNITIGRFAGHELTIGSSNILIGNRAGTERLVWATTSGNNNIIIGNNIGTTDPEDDNYLNIGGVIKGPMDGTGDLTIGFTTDTDALKLDSSKDLYLTDGDLYVQNGGTTKIKLNATSTPQILLQHTSYQQLRFDNTTNSPGAGVLIGQIEFYGKDDGSAQHRYAFIEARTGDDSAGGEGGYIEFIGTYGGQQKSCLQLGHEGGRGLAVEINRDNNDVDFRVHGDTNDDIFKVDAGTEQIQLGGDLLPSTSGIYDLGSATLPFADIYSTGGSIYVEKVKTIYYDGSSVCVSGTICGDGSNLTSVTPDAHTHDGDTLQIDGLNSDGGAFSFTTTGAVTFNQSVDIDGSLTISGTSKAGGYFYAGAVAPTDVDRLNYSGYFYATRVYNPVYSDFADYQKAADSVKFGFCYYDTLEGAKICNKRCQKSVIGIASDTYGQAVGKSDGTEQVPIAVSGWVLAHVDKEYEPGTPLVNDENGMLTEAKMREKIRYPERLVAIYKKKEGLEYFGPDLTPVNGRHWVKVK